MKIEFIPVCYPDDYAWRKIPEREILPDFVVWVEKKVERNGDQKL